MIRLLMAVSILMLFTLNNGWAATTLQGYIYTTKPIANSVVIVRDLQSNTLQTMTDETGFYQLDISGLIAPLIVSSDNDVLNPNTYQLNKNSATNRVSSLLNVLLVDQINIVNVNSFTDLLVSELAVELGYIGPEQLISQGITHPVTQDRLASIYLRFHQMFDSSLQQVGIDPRQFDPINTVDDRINMLLTLILHNRSYDSKSGEIGRTMLLDRRFRAITEQTPFDFEQASREQNDNIKAAKRLFIISDSTASNYERKVYPRMGWGQVFERFIAKNENVVVINGAQSGRSSRSFYNEGWFAMMEPLMQKGDYLIIAFGHNDEKCDSSKLDRGQVDVMNLCTYPNDADNTQQYPQGQQYMSFQTSLERYIDSTKEKGMITILMTPVTRFRDEDNKTAYQHNRLKPVVSTHFTSHQKGFLYWGNYSDTIKYTATVNDVYLIDLEKLSINFANQHKDDWQRYWLVVDPNDDRYPYYKTQSSGVIGHPDITHFQESGALAIAKVIATAIKEDPKLHELAILLDSNVIK